MIDNRDPEWNSAQREILRSAIRKAQAGSEQREVVRMTGAEAEALYRAADAWEGMMAMLDEAHAAGRLKGLTS